MDTATINTNENKTPDLQPNKPTTPGNSSTAKPRKALLTKFVTLSTAKDEEEDMRVVLQYAEKRAGFVDGLNCRWEEIQQLVAFHCGLANPGLVQMPEIFDGLKVVWLHGSFNLCIPVCINSAGLDHSGRLLPSKLGFRVPLPYKLGEDAFPRNAEEKVRSEAATYIWIDKNCPDVPIPVLRGFGVPGGLSVGLLQPLTKCKLLTPASTQFYEPRVVPFWQRIKFYTWRFDRCLVPQHRIGFWTIDNEGHITLTNCPMFFHFNQFEKWSIPSSIPWSRTYTSADSFYLDLLSGHDNCLRYQRNSAFSEIDAHGQARDLVLMRALLHQFTDQQLCDGPFVMQLTDM
ncbi:hypothetical protein AJ80_08948 [Polytolypa hystricis UAMH7299]|uniref:Uncharacterized protein n=1 Tax=Polytolypa hystricis (strain UAMH7299) TaxID=1447883 RepID=A0A2B7WYJ1_POLH7|nr:hypothetical protein AJ80_08948 [Polytolypa hystricis UAMH7299]